MVVVLGVDLLHGRSARRECTSHPRPRRASLVRRAVTHVAGHVDHERCEQTEEHQQHQSQPDPSAGPPAPVMPSVVHHALHRHASSAERQGRTARGPAVRRRFDRRDPATLGDVRALFAVRKGGRMCSAARIGGACGPASAGSLWIRLEVRVRACRRGCRGGRRACGWRGRRCRSGRRRRGRCGQGPGPSHRWCRRRWRRRCDTGLWLSHTRHQLGRPCISSTVTLAGLPFGRPAETWW